MQTKAVIRAAINVNERHPDWHIKPEIMIPLIGHIKSLEISIYVILQIKR